MSMFITSNYKNYYKNTASNAGNAKRESGQSAQVNTNTSENGKDAVQEYYERLCKQFPQISSINTDGDRKVSSKNEIVLNLSKECLKKMAGDPQFARKIENDIAGIPAAHQWMYAQAKSDGMEIHDFSVKINSDGSMQCSCSSTTRTSAGGQGKTFGSTKKKRDDKAAEKRREQEEFARRAEKKRAGREAEEQKTAQRQMENKAFSHEWTKEYTKGFDLRA